MNYDLTLDPATKSFGLAVPGEPSQKTADFTYEDPDPDHMLLNGTFKGRHMNLTLRRMDLSQFLLLNRGLHIINQR